ncbi:uncharacterized protein KD926_008336 [Aspergillus affinis]|uniref:uncharacterized protein n=1 Tax=Aspergillus affinis TaxID=1070780 RepID=UPI0022FE42D8|nr:uncharacterized protein KD926_008336 [Aspergillus affinis]KAI9040379.1 hypothetical protein KD926_008336 [Aspergillus affinis]
MENTATSEEPVRAVSRVPNEIWTRIFYALEFDYRSLWAVYATCVQFHQCVQPALFYHLHVHFVENTIPEHKPFDKRIAYHRPWVQFNDVRVLEISDSYSHLECNTRVTRSLQSLFELIPGVRVIKWKSRREINQSILDMFKYFQRPIIIDIQGAQEIFIYNATIFRMLHAFPLLYIRSLDINLEHWDQENGVLKRSLFPICSLPTLKALTLTYRATAPSFKVCNIIIPPGARLARLKSLRLYNVHMQGVGDSEWTRSLQCSALRHLTIDGYFLTMQALKQLAGKVPNLKSLSVRLRNEEDQISEPLPFETRARFLDDASPSICFTLGCFLRGVRALEEFNGYDLPLSTLNDLLLFQGQYLQTLRFRDTVVRDTDRGAGAVFFGCDQLVWMIHQLPVLKTLGITMAIGRETVPMLNYISRIPLLTRLEINTPPEAFLEDDENETPPPRTIPIPLELLEQIFDYLDRRKRYYSAVVGNNQWPSFNALDMIAREWEPMLGGMRWAFWGLKSTYIYTCRRKIGSPREVEVSFVSGAGLSLMCVHRYNQVLTATEIWDRPGTYSFDDTSGVEFFNE